MNERELREQLRRLSAELEHLPDMSEHRQHLQRLIGDIEGRLGGDPDEGESLLDQVETAVSMFEAEHPRLAAVLNNIMVTLTSMGV